MHTRSDGLVALFDAMSITEWHVSRYPIYIAIFIAVCALCFLSSIFYIYVELVFFFYSRDIFQIFFFENLDTKYPQLKLNRM